jgi:hypothetical protein
MVERRRKSRTAVDAHPMAGSARLPVHSESSKQRLTLNLDGDLIDRARNAVFWTPGLTLSGLAERALQEAIEKLERGRGDAFPQRSEDLRAGRPPK